MDKSKGITKEEVGAIVGKFFYMSEEQLKAVSKALSTALEINRKEKIARVKSKIKKGDRFKITSGDMEGEVGIVKKVKRTRIDGSVNGQGYNIPLSMIEKLEEN